MEVRHGEMERTKASEEKGRGRKGGRERGREGWREEGVSQEAELSVNFLGNDIGFFRHTLLGGVCPMGGRTLFLLIPN